MIGIYLAGVMLTGVIMIWLKSMEYHRTDLTEEEWKTESIWIMVYSVGWPMFALWYFITWLLKNASRG